MAPRVLVDATDVPADRGALGRYVDGLIGALDVAGADMAVVCQRADEERYERLAPGARVVAGPTALSHRSARLAWEQSGLPVVAQQIGADVIHVPYYSMPLVAAADRGTRADGGAIVLVRARRAAVQPGRQNPHSAGMGANQGGRANR